MSEKKNEGGKKVTTWTEIVAFGEGILKKGGGLTEDDIKTMARLFDTLDESTLPEGVRFPLGYQGDEKEQS